MSDRTVTQMSLFQADSTALPDAEGRAEVEADRPSLGARCTGLLFCHRCGMPTSRAADAEFCPFCHARRCTNCGDV